MTTPMDPAIAKGVELARLHKRLRRDDSDAITELHVTHAKSLAGLEKFPDLEILILAGCDPVVLDALPALEKLLSLRIHDSGLRRLEGIANFPSLRLLATPRNLIQDLSPLLECDLADLEIDGNPLTRNSYDVAIPELTRRGCNVSRSQEREWRASLRCREEGIPLGCYRSGDDYYLFSPGLEVTESPDTDHPKVEIEEVEDLLAREPGKLLELFRERGGIWPPPSH
ncbi:hypothetical protein ACFUJY_16565 [Streptomyces sp. NPDC057249]|uniref:hypothetical protein n=1 Tax=Streptomyces sp. NPDC057249 TaxID=3346067 RepID=UPI003637BFD4